MFQRTLFFWLLVTLPAVAQHLQFEAVTGFTNPLFLTQPPMEDEFLYVVEKGGNIRILPETPNPLFLSSSVLINAPGGFDTASERGLLGLAFHPDYQSNRYFYIAYSDASGATRISRLQRLAGANAADPATLTPVLTIPQPLANHNGGWIAFGPDNFLYVSSGDGGGSNDPDNYAQNTTSLLGKLLRIDVNGDDFPADPARNYAIPSSNPVSSNVGWAPEIWALGLRNAWRNSFYRLTGDLWIADVGQSSFEEINFQSAQSAGGENYGWRLREGPVPTPTGGVGGPAPMGAIDPFYAYAHGVQPNQGRSITGGYVYRGPINELKGHYFFADYIHPRVWSLRRSSGQPADFTNWSSDLVVGNLPFRFIASLGEDNEGNLYFINIVDGIVFKLVGGTVRDISKPGIALSGKSFRHVKKKRPVVRGMAWDNRQVVAVFYKQKNRVRMAQGTTTWKFRPLLRRGRTTLLRVWAIDQQGLVSDVIRSRIRRR